jgi:hypothetical protein
MPDTTILNTVTSSYDPTAPTPQDFWPNNSEGGINAEKLSNEDYAPGLNKGILAGNYSGSEVGSIQLFAPQGNVVPFAAYAARDRAVEKAAMDRMKDMMAYQKDIKPPSTKLVNVNPHLHDAYYNMIESEQNRMKKQYGKNWVKASATDIDFQRNRQNYEDLAKYHDNFVTQYAQDDQDMKTGKFVPTPGYLDTRKKIEKATEFINDPNNENVKGLSENFLKFGLEREFSGIANDFMEKQVKQVLDNAGVDESNPDYYKMVSSKKTQFTDDQLKNTAKAIKTIIYPTSDYWTEDNVYKNLKSMFGNVQEDKSVSISQKREGSGDESFDVTDMEESTHSINVQPLPKAGDVGVQRETQFGMQNYGAFTKPIKVDAAIGRTIYPTAVVERKKGDKVIKEGGLFPTQQPEDKTVTLGGIGIGDVDVATGKPVTADQIAAHPEMKTKKAVLVHGNYQSAVVEKPDEMDENGNAVASKKDTPVPFVAEAKSYKNLFNKKKVKDGTALYDYLEKKVEDINKAAEPKMSSSSTKEETARGNAKNATKVMTGKSKSGKDIISKDGGKTWIYK